MSDIASLIAKNLLTFDFFRKAWDFSSKKHTGHIRDEYSIEKLSEDFFNRRIDIGSTVSVRGFLSRYGVHYLPNAYSFTIGIASRGVTPRFHKKSHRLINLEKYRFIKTDLLQPPIQMLPLIKGEQGEYNILFLYHEKFTDFHFEKSESIIDMYNIGFKADILHSPLLVLVDKTDYINLSERHLKLVGKIALIPDNAAKIVFNSCNKFTRDLLNLSIRPFSSEAGFCIDCRKPENKDFVNISDRAKTLKANIFAEAHFDNISNSATSEAIQKQIPNVFGYVFNDDQPTITKIGSNELNLSSFPNFTGVNLVQKGDAFCFYTETDLMNTVKMDESLKKLSLIYQRFKDETNRVVLVKEGQEANLSLDFIYDFSKQEVIQKVLLSKEVYQIIESNPNLIETIHWLRA